MKTHNVESVKDFLVQKGYCNDDLKGYSLAGISDIGGLLNNSLSFYFYDYGDQKEALDEIMPVFLADDLSTYDVTENSNSTIYEKDRENAYLLYVRVDNTLLLISGPKEKKEEIRSLAKGLGYYR